MSASAAAITANPTTVLEAETAWLAALVAESQDGLRRLMHPDCVVVHGPAGHISNRDQFLAYSAGVGRNSDVRVLDVAVQEISGVTIVSCLQESRIAFVPDLTPFLIQAAVSRVWVPGQDGWLLAHMQMARRQSPG